jgi:hypothetical protein
MKMLYFDWMISVYYLATGTMPVSNHFPRALYMWHRFSRVIFIYFGQDLNTLK